MSRSDLPLIIVLAADVVVCIGMVIYRKPLAGWSVARSRFWRNRPHAQRINEACILLGAVLFLGMSVFILYDIYVVQPRSGRGWKTSCGCRRPRSLRISVEHERWNREHPESCCMWGSSR